MHVMFLVWLIGVIIVASIILHANKPSEEERWRKMQTKFRRTQAYERREKNGTYIF